MIRSLIFLIFFALLYFQYQEMATALPEIEMEMGEISIKAYTDRILLTFPLNIRNVGNGDVTEVTYKFYLDDTFIEERKMISPLLPSESTSVLMEEVTLKNDVLNSVILTEIKKCQECKPEDMSLKITVEANLPLHPKLDIDVPKGKAGQNILLRSMMGGRTKEEFAQALVNLTLSATLDK